MPPTSAPTRSALGKTVLAPPTTSFGPTPLELLNAPVRSLSTHLRSGRRILSSGVQLLSNLAAPSLLLRSELFEMADPVSLDVSEPQVAIEFAQDCKTTTQGIRNNKQKQEQSATTAVRSAPSGLPDYPRWYLAPCYRRRTFSDIPGDMAFGQPTALSHYV